MEFKLPERPQDSNKGTFGKVLNIAGSYNYPGAAYLSSIAALKVGCGLVALASTKDVIQAISAQTPDVVFLQRKDIPKVIKNYTAVSIGCGLGLDKRTINLFNHTIKQLLASKTPTVIDGSGLTILAKSNFILDKNFILTPHPKEASKLLNTSIEEILSNPDYWAKRLAEKYNCITLIKGARTRVYKTGEDIYVNTTGCSALAKAGSGDVLCGIISGLLAQGIECFEATKLGVYLHGRAGENAAKIKGEHGVLASELLQFIYL